MKTSEKHDGTPPDPIRRHTFLASVLGMVLAVCLSGPAQAEVIDDFEQGYRFWVNGGDKNSHVEILDGQLKVTVPADGFVAAGYLRLCSLPEAETVTFAVDLVGLSSTVWSVGLGSETTSPSGGYGLYRHRSHLWLAKWWDGGGTWLREVQIPAFGAAETLSLSLTRQGDSLLVAAKVAYRATGEVLGNISFLDTPDVDPTLGSPDQDNGAPLLGLRHNVGCATYGGDGGEVAFDNLVCSHPPAQQILGIERASLGEVAVSWEGNAALLESTSPKGPWTPCIAEASSSESRFTGDVPLLDPQRFFALATGRYFASRFDELAPWHAAKADVGAPGGTFGVQVSSGQASAYGRDLGDRDFLIRRDVTGLWWRDCVASVDLLNWREDMEEGTAFGIVLRAKPRTGFWLIEEEGLPENRYIGLLTFNKPGSPEESTLSITGPEGELLQETTMPAVDLLRDYRLRFWAVGEQLKLELCDTEDLATPIATCEASDDRCPTGIEALFVKPSPTGQTQIDFDNFLLWGVWTPAEW